MLIVHVQDGVLKPRGLGPEHVADPDRAHHRDDVLGLEVVLIEVGVAEESGDLQITFPILPNNHLDGDGVTLFDFAEVHGLALHLHEERAVLVVAVQLEDAGDLVAALTFFLDASVHAVQPLLGGVEGVLDEGFVDQVVGDDVEVIGLEAGVDDDADQIDGTHLGFAPSVLFRGDDFEAARHVPLSAAGVIEDYVTSSHAVIGVSVIGSVHLTLFQMQAGTGLDALD